LRLDTFEDEEGEEYEASSFGGFSDYFRRKKIKLQNLDAELRSSSSENPRIFRGVVAHVNGYTQPSLNDIHRLIVAHGGGFLQYLDKKTTVTHIIASSLTLKKRVEFRNYRIVKPAWVVESVRAGRLLPWDDFRVVDEGRSQKVLGFDNGKIISQTTGSQLGYKEQTQDCWYTSQVKEQLSELRSDGNVSFPGYLSVPFDDLHDSESSAVKTGYMPAPDIRDRPRGERAPRGAIRPFYGSSGSSLGNQRSIAALNLDGRRQLDEVPPGEETPPMDSVSSESESELSIAESRSESVPPNSPGKENAGRNLSEYGTTIDQNSDEGSQSQHNEPTKTPDPQSPNGTEGSHLSDPLNSRRPTMTAEEHNAILLADPRIRNTSVLNPNFLSQYYSESRLHHLSNWKAELKSQLQQLTAAKCPSQRARHKRPPNSRRYIFHVDFDSFFAAVSLKTHPEFKDKPVVVAHGSGSGSEIASCNYPARKFGVKNGMWMKQAQHMCPDLKVLPYDFQAYEEASRLFYNAILSIDGVVQSVSIDEALIDVSALCLGAGGVDGGVLSEDVIRREQAKADEVAEDLRNEIRKKTECEVSVGIGGNILLAKVALRKAKPAGQYQIKPEEVLDFIGNLTVQDLPGVAHSIGAKLEDIGVKFVRDIHSISRERLTSALGPKTGGKLWDYSRGVDRTEVGEVVVRKSVSADVNWGVRFENQKQAEDFVYSLSGELHRRLDAQKVKGRRLTMKIMRRAADAPLDPPKHLGHGKCDVFNKSVVLGVATSVQDVLGREAISVLRSFGFSPGELRGIGMQMTKLEPLKGALDKQMESRQKVLQFKAKGRPKRDLEDPIVDDIESPQRKIAQRPHPAALTTMPKDPLNASEQKPLNTLGTQFIIPSQIDPSVAAELPEEIRSKIIGSRSPSKFPKVSNSPVPGVIVRKDTPASPQLDQEALEALPPDIREEVLAFYRPRSPPPSKPRQTPAPPPLKKGNENVLKNGPKKPAAYTKKNRVGPSISRGGKGEGNPTLTQSAFIRPGSSSGRDITGKKSDMDQRNSDDEEDMDPEFLAALPDDIRRELLEESRRARLKRRANLDFDRNITPRKPMTLTPPPEQRRLRLPPRPPRPTFTTQRLSTLPELREVISAWHEEFRDEGPYEEDVEAFNKHLRRVVCEERNLAKAVALVRWLGWVVGGAYDDDEKSSSGGKDTWKRALERTQETVQAAVRERGLGEVAGLALGRKSLAGRKGGRMNNGDDDDR
jgi:DNA repair protein REV1